MKRLRKTANKYQHFIEEWWNHWGTVINEAEQMLAENPDCKYDGEAYRAIGFRSFDDMIKGFASQALYYDGILNAIKKNIRVTSEYCSWSYDYDTVDEFADDLIENGDICVVIIEGNISGLDLGYLIKKYKDQLEDGYTDGTDMEYEIIAPMVSDFRIKDIIVKDPTNGIIKMNEDNPGWVAKTPNGYITDYE